jgi:DNA adenine methylase
MPDNSDQTQAKPFLKWAGGKRQLLSQLESHFPSQLLDGEIYRYAEPFVGSGALFFKVFQTFPIRECLLADVNPELILVYKTLQEDVLGLISRLGEIEQHYLDLDPDQRKEFYYQVRENYNRQRESIQFLEFEANWITRAADMLFLNRTGYNGLFRLNSKGAYNVPFGRYKNPRILDEENLRRAAKLLQGATIHYGDFEETGEFVNEYTLVYFDPPYRPLSSTAHFTSYSKERFDDAQQRRLADFYRALDAKGAKLMLSNSDPHNVDPDDDFFEDAYRGFRIERLKARRNINRAADKRGQISEIVILNYDPDS